MPKKVDRLDLVLAEIEARKVTEIRQVIFGEILKNCRENNPSCPYINSTKICKSIRNTLRESIPEILQEMNEEN